MRKGEVKKARRVRRVKAAAVEPPAPPRIESISAVDPGNTESAWVVYDPHLRAPVLKELLPNHELLQRLRRRRLSNPNEVLAIEMMKPRGMGTSWEEFETCVWIGRLIEAWGGPWAYVFRHDVKIAICGRGHAKDGNIRLALIDRWGGKEAAVGRKGSEGPLYGFKRDLWSALAVAITYAETKWEG